ncbi:hypothetical protein ACFR9U_16815 [Halorientalis brevis]|uniref:Uncharacterized protein n=1 Tax=Halorientalis brevis TaxID=1126241 RepID=A0ABD6CEK6_9EURY|nr:hypothetical protein [Halorientalis brevis]
MTQEVDGDRVRKAVRILREEFGTPNQLELYYYDHDDEKHINFHCPDEVPGVEASADDRYRLRRTELSGTVAWSLDPIEIPSALKD